MSVPRYSASCDGDNTPVDPTTALYYKNTKARSTRYPRNPRGREYYLRAAAAATRPQSTPWQQPAVGSSPSRPKKTSSLPDFSSQLKSQQSTAESSPVRSILTESTESKSDIYASRFENPNKFTPRKKSRSFEEKELQKPTPVVAPKKKAQKKLCANTKDKVKQILSGLTNPAFWYGSKPVLLPTSRSPSRLSRLSDRLFECARPEKVKKSKGDNSPELTDPPQPSQSQPSTSSKNKTKGTLNSESKSKTTSTTTTTTTTTKTTTTTDDKQVLERLSPNVENTHDSNGLKTQRLISTDDAAHRLSTVYYEEEPQFSRYDRTEQDQYSAKRRIKRRLPDIELLYPQLKVALNRPYQQESCHQGVQDKYGKYVESKSTVRPDNVSSDYKQVIHYSEENPPGTFRSCSERTQHNVRHSPRRRIPDITHLGYRPEDRLSQRKDSQDEHTYYNTSSKDAVRRQPALISGYKNPEQATEQIVKHQCKEERSDQRAVDTTKQQSRRPQNSEQIQTQQEHLEEHSYEQSPHGAIRRQPLQQSQSKREKKKQKTEQSKQGAVRSEQSQKKYFEHVKQYRAKIEQSEDSTIKLVPLDPENLDQSKLKRRKESEPHETINRQQQSELESNVPISSDELRHQELQNERYKQQEQNRLVTEQSSYEELEVSKQLQKAPLVAKQEQLQVPGRSVKEPQSQRQQKKHRQEEDPIPVVWLQNPPTYCPKSFWTRESSNQIELASPFELVDSEAEDFYLNLLLNPESRPDYPTEPLEITSQENLPPENINAIYTESTSVRYLRHKEYLMGRMGSLEDHERKVIIEFCHLLEKSKQLFNGLRELPQYGHKQWHSYFGRTFDVYTKLWKFQQQHRAVLDNKYGLKRWQIGEIASKIGQLYYHFYLRTSETAYLNESFSFYSAIRGRSYYTKASKEDKCELMVKKLRYYARYIVVCLLLKKVKLVRDLIKELDRQIIEYGNTYDPDDQAEWNIVVEEVKAFIQAEPVVSVIHPDNYSVTLSHRLSTITTPPIERTSQMNLSLQEVLIVGSSSQQVKFSELTMDMFRMLQTLEREPTGDIQYMYDDSPRQRFNLTPSVLNTKGYNLEGAAPRPENPHKYLLFKPSPTQILVYLASGCNDLPPNAALLLYISADGQIIPSSKHPEDGYDIGGLITTSKTEFYRDSNKEKGSQSKNKESQCLHPGDLYPFTRRPLFIIIDSDNSYVFNNIPRHFGQPLVILMSPVEVPASLNVSDRRHQGSLFTLFLHAPLTAFCHCCDIHTIPLVHWDRAQNYIDTFLAEATQLLTRSRIDVMFLNFMGDDFLRILILRFVFCEVVLRMHRAFRARTQLTRSSPAIPDDLLEHPALVHIVMDLASHLQVRGHFHDSSTSAGPPPPKE